MRRNSDREAAASFARCLAGAPDFAYARLCRARLLLRMHDYVEALDEIERLLLADIRNPLFRQIKASVLGALGEDVEALSIWQQLAQEYPDHAETWICCGDSLRAIGRQTESLAAYRTAIGHRPSYGLAWWSLANMKTVRFSADDIVQMQCALAGTEADANDRANLLFALGKAHEDQRAWEKAFSYYAKGNAARRLRTDYDWEDMTRELAAQKSVFARAFFQERRDAGCKSRDPIFILGRPRAGSTLLEQILSSHPDVEGTAELPYIADFAFELTRRSRAAGSDYPQIIAQLDPVELLSMGEAYMERARIHRKLGRPLFVDKSPANYHQIGLILLILPNARIIDARRNPAACCFSMFKHNYTDTNLRLSELGRVYRDYVSLMAHFDRVAPGRIHRVIYERMIADPGREIRRLLDYLGLGFDEKCLRFHETERAVRTPSSEQVRRPISADAVEHWRNFEPWLSPLVASLGSVLTAYPDVPDDLA